MQTTCYTLFAIINQRRHYYCDTGWFCHEDFESNVRIFSAVYQIHNFLNSLGENLPAPAEKIFVLEHTLELSPLLTPARTVTKSINYAVGGRASQGDIDCV